MEVGNPSSFVGSDFESFDDNWGAGTEIPGADRKIPVATNIAIAHPIPVRRRVDLNLASAVAMRTAMAPAKGLRLRSSTCEEVEPCRFGQ